MLTKEEKQVRIESGKIKRLKKTSRVLKRNLSRKEPPRERESLIKLNSRLPKKLTESESVFSEDAIWKAWKDVYRSKTKKKRRLSMGVDKVSVEKFKENDNIYIEEVHRQLSGGFFVFDDLLHFSVLKEGKKPRDIQAPTIRDRIVQKIINGYLVRNKFKDIFLSTGIVGSVEGSSIRQIMKDILEFNKEGYVYILKTDIVNYFPSINVARLKKILDYYIKDKELKKYLYQYLEKTKMPGIAQGPPLSPLMANLYLSNLDKKLSKKKKIRHVRYVDDLLIFCKTKKEAERQYDYLKKYFKKINLKIHELGIPKSKTKIDKFDSGNVDTLGVIKKDDKFLIKKDKLLKFIHETVEPLKRSRNIPWAKNAFVEILWIIESANEKIIGWGGSYSFCNVSKTFTKLDDLIFKNISILCDKLRLSKNQKEIALKKIKKLAQLKSDPIIKS